MGKLPLPSAKHKRGGAMALNEQFIEKEIHPIDIDLETKPSDKVIEDLEALENVINVRAI